MFKRNFFSYKTTLFIEWRSPLSPVIILQPLFHKSKIFIGTNSGLNNLPLLFKTPILYLNLVPLSQLNSQPNSLGVPKLLRKKKDGKFLKFNEALQEPFGNSFFDKTFNDAGLEVIDNDSDLILDCTIEALQRLNGSFVESQIDKNLQINFPKMPT